MGLRVKRQLKLLIKFSLGTFSFLFFLLIEKISKNGLRFSRIVIVDTRSVTRFIKTILFLNETRRAWHERNFVPMYLRQCLFLVYLKTFALCDKAKRGELTTTFVFSFFFSLSFSLFLRPSYKQIFISISIYIYIFIYLYIYILIIIIIKRVVNVTSNVYVNGFNNIIQKHGMLHR